MKTPCVFQVVKPSAAAGFPKHPPHCFLDHIETMQIARMMYNVRYVFELTPWLFNIAMGNDPFIDGLPFLKMVIFHGYVK